MSGIEPLPMDAVILNEAVRRSEEPPHLCCANQIRNQYISDLSF